MATVIIKKSAAIVFVGRYLTLPIAQNMATIKAAEYGVGTTAWTTDQDLPTQTHRRLRLRSRLGRSNGRAVVRDL
jgi:hypothetical protein